MARNDVTQWQLAVGARVSYKTVHNLLSEKMEPRPSTIGRIADALGTTPDFLLTGTGRAVVREQRCVYPVGGGENDRSPGGTMRDAIRIIAKDLNVRESDVAAKIAELMQKSTEGE